MRNKSAAEGTKNGCALKVVWPFVFDATIAGNGQRTVLIELKFRDVRTFLSKFVEQFCCIIVCEKDVGSGSKYKKEIPNRYWHGLYFTFS